MRRPGTLLLFLTIVVGGGLCIGIVTAPGEWYFGLAKPSFNPPNWVFAPAWTALYVLVSIAGWRTFERDRRGWAMKVWLTQLFLNFAWSPAFFAAHQIWLALAIILLLLADIITFMIVSWRQDRLATWLFVPYAAWVAFASTLNGAIYLSN